MTLLNVGQPIGGIIQVAYTMPDIDARLEVACKLGRNTRHLAIQEQRHRAR